VLPDAAASNLVENYLKQGRSTIPEIGAKYSEPGAANDPYGTSKDGRPKVQQIYTKMGGTRTRFGPQQVGPGVDIIRGYNEPPEDGDQGYDQSLSI
jgi:hypothetical protein